MTVTRQIALSFEVTRVDTSGLASAVAIFREELETACEDIGLHVQERVKGIITTEGIRYTSALLDSITWSLFVETASIIGVAVGTNLSYALYQEFGTVPHFVPFHMAKTLYDQAISDWGYIKVDPNESGRLNATPGKAVSKGPGGMSIITGKHQSYLTKHPDRLWLRSEPGGRPLWGVVVSGHKQPFLFPGWEQSVEYAEKRLTEACQQAAARANGGV